MEAFFAAKLDAYVEGKISRRALIESLVGAVSAAPIAVQAAPASDPALKAQLFNHISYTCPDFRKAADWYSKVFNLDQVGMRATDVALPLGKKGEKPFGVTADDVPLTHIICRTHDRPATLPASAEAPPKSQALIDYVGYTVADFDRDRARTELKALGVENLRDSGRYSLRMTDPFGYEVRISGLANDALTDGV